MENAILVNVNGDEAFFKDKGGIDRFERAQSALSEHGIPVEYLDLTENDRLFFSGNKVSWRQCRI